MRKTKIKNMRKKKTSWTHLELNGHKEFELNLEQ